MRFIDFSPDTNININYTHKKPLVRTNQRIGAHQLKIGQHQSGNRCSQKIYACSQKLVGCAELCARIYFYGACRLYKFVRSHAKRFGRFVVKKKHKLFLCFPCFLCEIIKEYGFYWWDCVCCAIFTSRDVWSGGAFVCLGSCHTPPLQAAPPPIARKYPERGRAYDTNF